MPMFPRTPFGPFDSTVRRMIDSMSSPRGAYSRSSVDQSVDEQNQTLKVTMDIQGVRKDDIDLSVDEKSGRKHLRLQVSSETEDTSRYYRQEIPLKAPVDEDLAEAEYNNGVLTVRFPILEDDSSGTSISIE